MRRVISLILAICMMLGVCTISANATPITINDKFCVGNNVYPIGSAGTVTTGTNWKFTKGNGTDYDEFELTGDLVLTSCSNISAFGGSSGENMALFFPNNTKIILNNFKLTIDAGSNPNFLAIYCMEDIDIESSGDGKIEISASNNCIYSDTGNISIKNSSISATTGDTGIFSNTGDILIDNSSISATTGKVGIVAGDGNISIINGSKVVTTATDNSGIMVDEDNAYIYICDSTVTAISNSEYGILANGQYTNIIIDKSIVTAYGDELGIFSDNLISKNSSSIYARGTTENGISVSSNITFTDTYAELVGNSGAMLHLGTFSADTAEILVSTSTNLSSCIDQPYYFDNTNNTYMIGSEYVKAIKFRSLSYNNNGSTVVEEDHEEDPEVDIEINGFNTTMKYGNNTIVLDKNTYNKTKNNNDKNYRIDISKANAKIYDVIVQRDVVEDLAKQGKGIEFENRYGFMVIEELEEKPNSSVVIGVREDVASYPHVKAIGTNHVEAEFNIAYKANGKEIDGDAKVYIPCDIKEPRLFYVIDEHTVGELKCEVSGGYAVFDRYLDGTYVVCK